MKTLSRRRAILAGSGFAASILIPGGSWAAVDAVAETANGRVRGSRIAGVSTFLGIPYGGSVSGKARFKAPGPALSWAGIRDATRLGSPSIQPPNQTRGINEPAPAEDCLVLNVWTPAADGGRRPVMFYSHGGGFTTGSGGSFMQDGANLARQYDVVVVECNHRLGLLGYLYLRDLLGPDYEGNQGLLDIVAALKWVNANIGRFGGDAANVMIFGESGGGAKTSALYTMPLADPLFSKASIESSVALRNNTPDRATEQARLVLQRLGLSQGEAGKLLEIPASALLKVQVGDAPNLGPGTVAPGGATGTPALDFSPVIDGRILPEIPFEKHAPLISARKPLIVGGCRDETVFFYRLDKAVFQLDEAGLKARLLPLFQGETDEWIAAFRQARPRATPSELFIAITTAKPWHAYDVHVAEMKATQAAAPVYSYILSYNTTLKIPQTNFRMGSPHASDIELKFNDVRLPKGQKAVLFDDDQTPARYRSAHNMSEMWASFARTGRPAAKGQPQWTPYTLEQRATMIIDSRCRMENDPEGAERKFWQSKGVNGFGA